MRISSIKVHMNYWFWGCRLESDLLLTANSRDHTVRSLIKSPMVFRLVGSMLGYFFLTVVVVDLSSSISWFPSGLGNIKTILPFSPVMSGPDILSERPPVIKVVRRRDVQVPRSTIRHCQIPFRFQDYLTDLYTKLTKAVLNCLKWWFLSRAIRRQISQN